MTIAFALTSEPLIAVLRGQDPRKVSEAAKVLVDNGVRNIEITLTVPQAPRILSGLITARPEARVGMGTLETPQDVARSVDAGAHFLVSPGSPVELLEALRGCGVESMPGVLTPSEAMMAVRHGFTMLKLFPAGTVGTGFIRHLKAPLPAIDWVPSGGLTISEAAAWLAAGARGVGLGSLASAEDIHAQDWRNVQAKTRRALAAVSGGTR